MDLDSGLIQPLLCQWQSASLFKEVYFRIKFFQWCIQVFFHIFNFSSQEFESSNTFHLYKAYSEANYSVLRPVTSMFSSDDIKSSSLK